MIYFPDLMFLTSNHDVSFINLTLNSLNCVHVQLYLSRPVKPGEV